MTLSSVQQQPGTDLVDEHNQVNIQRLNAMVAQVNKLPEDSGHVAQAAVKIATNPTGTDTITIGSDVYEWDGAGSNINVAIGGDAAASRAALVTAINTLGTELVVADQPTSPATSVRIRPADRVGGTAQIGAGPSLALSSSLTAGTDGWNSDDLSETGAPAYKKRASGKVVVGTNNLALTLAIELPFTPVALEWAAFNASGAPKVTTATVALNGDYIEMDFDAGGTALVATDFVVWIAHGN